MVLRQRTEYASLMRRLTGLVTTFLMLHLAVMSRDVQCTARGVSAGASMTMMHGGHTDGGRMPSSERQPRGRAPASGDCCQSMISCGLSAMVTPGLTLGVPACDHQFVKYAQSETPGLRGAPPTPPPRA